MSAFDVLAIDIVALRKESVDRNNPTIMNTATDTVSLSARRAWIEIQRNQQPRQQAERSLSARRAWIEMMMVSASAAVMAGRSPQGERG